MKHVILITDGDKYARMAVERAAENLNCGCLLESAGNPSPCTEMEISREVINQPCDPVIVMFDDGGYKGIGAGEHGIEQLAKHPEIELLGALAVASNSQHKEWCRVDVSVDIDGNLTEYGVDKEGLPDLEIGRISGDTVYILDRLDLTVVVGIGDIGKMRDQDKAEIGAPLTTAAIQLIMERSGYNEKAEKK